MMIEVDEVERGFTGRKAVDGVSFTVHAGEIFGLLGPNGAGKSTLVRLLATIIRPDRGRIVVDGCDTRADRDGVRRAIAVVFQDSTLDDRLSVEENLYFHARLRHLRRIQAQTRIDEVLRLFGLDSYRRVQVRILSGGTKRRLEIARAMLQTPRVLMLDEPTIGLDPQTRRLLWRHLLELNRREGLTLFLATQYLEEAEICGRAGILDGGRLVALDSPAGLKRAAGCGRDGTLEEAFLRLTGRGTGAETANGLDRLRESMRARRIS